MSRTNSRLGRLCCGQHSCGCASLLAQRRQPPEDFFIELEPYRRFLMRTRELAGAAELVASLVQPEGPAGIDQRAFLR